MTDYGAVVRQVTGSLACFSAGAQLVIRYMLYHHASPAVKRRERALSIAGFLVLGGVGQQFLTHPQSRMQFGSWMIAAGIMVTVYSIYLIWRYDGTKPAEYHEERQRKRRRGD